ncbi:polyribonucleotide nucleotidyltransferase, partial [candidate division KSB1 bacterium]
IRDISCKIGLLPRTHGSAVFTRGQTQALCVTTLGTKFDEQKIEAVHGDFSKSYMLHYNFPPFSVGEVRFLRGPGRREIGHGYLAERALKPVIPVEDNFPYTIRLVSDILESNGSSSMATVCAGSLSMMDAGVPVGDTVGGIAMGLIKEGDKISILSDILGDEDHIGDMDFKVTGTKKGITAFQMDVKCEGISFEVIHEVLQKAKNGRFHIIDIMNETISKPHEELSQYAPKIIILKIDTANIGTIIGSGGKVIREIQDKTGVTINIENDGTIFISAPNAESGKNAKDIIDGLLEEPEPGKIYKGTVKKIAQFGAFVEILPGKEGLLHISEIDNHHIKRVEDVLNVGDEVEVKLLRMEQQGKMVLSRKVLLKK